MENVVQFEPRDAAFVAVLVRDLPQGAVEHFKMSDRTIWPSIESYACLYFNYDTPAWLRMRDAGGSMKD